MQKIILLINPSDVSKAKVHLDTFQTGTFICPSIFRINILKQEIETAVHAFEYVLADVDFHFIALK